MATILKTDGTKVMVLPVGEVFTLKEISTIIDGIVEPIFIGDYWIFHAKNGNFLDRGANNTASVMVGFEIFGPIILAKDDELSPSFFIPPDVIREIKNVGKQLTNKQPPAPPDFPGEQQPEQPEPSEGGDKLSDEEKKEAMGRLLNEGYRMLIQSGKPFESLMQNFELFNDGVQKITVPANRERRIGAITKIIDYFTELEEYEKCAELVKFKNKVDDYYDNYLNN